MTNPLTQARNDIAAVLAAVPGVQAWAYHPSALTPPAAVVVPVPGGANYLVPGLVFGEYTITLNVRIFAYASENVVVTEALDELIVNVCAALREADYSVPYVNSPLIDKDTYDAAFLTVDITVTNINYKEDS